MRVRTEDIVKQIQSLPPLSEVVTKLAGLTQDPRANAISFADLIKQDPGLAANLLRVANSAAFGSRHRIDTVDHAVAILGRRRVLQLTLAGGLNNVLPPRLPGYDIGASEFGRHCGAVGLLAMGLSETLDLGHGQMVFTAGLLHDCGKLAIASFLNDHLELVKSRAFEGGMTFVAAEKEILGTNHTEVGAMLAREWRLPMEIQWVVQWHHRPGDAPDPVDRKLVGVIHIADSLAHAFGHGADVSHMHRSMDESVRAELGVTRGIADEVVSGTLDEILALAETFVEAENDSA